MAVPIMAQQHSITNNATGNSNRSYTTSQQEEDAGKPKMFHDFLGMKVVKEGERVASGTNSTISDLGSVERQVGNHLEGVPYYGPRSDISGPDFSNRLAGTKRSSSDSTFMGPLRDRVPQVASNSVENSHIMKILRTGAGGEQSRRSNDDEVFFGVQPLRPASASLLVRPPTGSRIDTGAPKWDRSTTTNLIEYPQRGGGGQITPFMHQASSNRLRDVNVGPSLVSQSAADEGSRTGMKGPGILSSHNASGGISEKNTFGVLPSGSRRKSGTQVFETESLLPSSRHGLTSASRQMTIFYGGQAHVFDDVHPSKADAIMALAGSNGGSWSTTFSPKSPVKQFGDSLIRSGEDEVGTSNNLANPRELRGRLPRTGSSGLAAGSGDRVSTPSGAGAHQGSAVAKDTRIPAHSAEPSAGHKGEI